MSTLETYEDESGTVRCDNCDEPADDCACFCVECGAHVTECSDDDGPAYPAVTR